MRTITSIIICLFVSTNISGQKHRSLEIFHLTGDFYIFTTYNYYNGSRIPANGMYLVTDSGAVIFDTPWDTTQFQPLLDSIKLRHNKSVTMCIATHFHSDRTGGLDYYRRQGIKTYTTKKTDEISEERHNKRAEFLVFKDTLFTAGQYSFQSYYAGQGHSPDNIIIWFNKERIIYGGCLIKSVEANDLGNLDDANVNEWEATIENIISNFKQPNFIIPGHQAWTSKQSLKHTLDLIKKFKESHR